MKIIQLYESFDDDFYDDGRERKLPEDYKYVRNSFPAKIVSALCYGAALLVGAIYCKLFLHIKFEGAKKLRRHKGAFFLYGNHTQPFGDVVIPALACFPKRIYSIAGLANFDLPVIGKALPYLGALPTDCTLRGAKELTKSVRMRIEQGHPVVIYPEAHVWPYYTKIRPFGEASFTFPVRLGVPVFSMTSTYRKRKHGNKPRLVLVIDGPFYPDGNLREAPGKLRDEVFESMQRATQTCDCEYITYVKKN